MDDGVGTVADEECHGRADGTRAMTPDGTTSVEATSAGVTFAERAVVPLGPGRAERQALIDGITAACVESDAGTEARLGAMLAARWADLRDPADRARALQLLRSARVRPGLGAGDRRAGARNLAVLLLAPLVEAAPAASGAAELPPGLARYLPFGLAATVPGTGGLAVLPEILELGRELAGENHPLPPHIEAIAAMVPLLRAAENGDPRALTEVLTALPSLLPQENRPGEPARPGASGLSGVPGVPGVPGGLAGLAVALPYIMKAYDLPSSTVDPAPADALRPVPPPGWRGEGDADTADIEELARSLNAPTILTEIISPGFVTLDDLRALTERTLADADAGDGSARAIAALSYLALGMRTGHQDCFDRALALLAEVRGSSGPVDQETEWLLQATVPAVLLGSHLTGHSLQDGQAAQELIEAALAPGGTLAANAVPERPGATDLLYMHHCIRAQFAIDRAQRDHDADALDEIRDELLSLAERETAEASEWRGLPRILLCVLELVRAQLTADLTALRRAVDQHAAALADTGSLPFVRPMLTTMEAPLLALATHLEPDPGRVRRSLASARAALEAPASVSGQRPRNRLAIGLALRTLHVHAPDPALLDETIAELHSAVSELDEQGGDQARGDAADLVVPLHQQLATALAERAGRADPAQDTAAHDRLSRALDHARRALRASADDVLLQLGAEHGLRAARAAGDLGVQAAGWAIRLDRPESAVACLEAGRALVLHAAAAGTTVADRLEALGAYDTARAWREATAATGASRPAALDDVLHPDATGTPRLPSALRREALELVRSAPGSTTLASPPPPQILGATLARCRADALVHLVPGTDGGPGAALLVRPGHAVRAVRLPGLSAESRGPLDAFLLAGAALRRGRNPDADDPSTVPPVRRPEHRWQQALDRLCIWAGESVVAPVLDALDVWERALTESGLRPAGTGPLPDPVRLVIVPCGDLGVVPWQAALLPLPDSDARDAVAGGLPATARLCELAVVTYAASGAELVHGTRRSRLPLAQGQALVSAPGFLLHAEDEIEALRAAYYAKARVLAEDDAGGGPDVPTPDAVLEVLGARSPRTGGGRAGLVHLACHGTAGADPTRSALHLWYPEDQPAGSGHLTVTTLLDTPSAGGRRGPLVVLSACETDLSNADHDEALTLTTALVHRLATDVIGSRWAVSDLITPALMMVLHHHLAAGLAPPDALRATQRHALTPAGHRRAVPGLATLEPFLAEQELGAVRDWAAFIHQGNPAPEPPRREPAS
ncbi:CHAT domain-containing protein [Streptomyces sp. NPDC001185]|uniref:CHAT domain-containing protein n=1 Tax=Streptomyces sp. NPDC001185 TaxID=3154380 RepID=UPI00331E0099